MLDKDEVSPDERRLGKTINFGVIYGMGAQRFARETGVSQSEAKEFLAKYKQRYPKVFAFLELQERLALSRGYVETILGRRRPFHFDRNGLGRLLGKDPLEIELDVARRGGMEAQQLRAAANAPIQGSSADIIKVAMVQLQDACSVRAYRLSCCCRCTTNWCSRWHRMPRRHPRAGSADYGTGRCTECSLGGGDRRRRELDGGEVRLLERSRRANHTKC